MREPDDGAPRLEDMRLLRPGLVALLALVLLGSCTSDPDRPSPSRTAAPRAAADWRTEYWRDVAVDVPAGWGWGSVPVGADRVVCGPAPGGAGYVGRPIATSDLCTPLELPPAAPYVWLGAEVGPGTVDLGEGWVQQTTEVAGETITVATDDAALRERILSSARPAGGPCESSIDRAPAGRFDWTTEGVGDLVSAELCVFRREGRGGLDLAYASAMTRSEVRRLLDAVLRADAASRRPCPEDDEVLVVRSVFTDRFGRPGARLRQEVVVRPTCGVVEVGPAPPAIVHRRSALTDAVTRALSVGGAGAVSRLLIGPLG